VGEPEKFLELARKTADLKCKQQKGERIKNGLMITGAAICMIGLVVMLFWMSLLQYTEDGWEIGEEPNDNQELSFCMNEIFKISQSNCAADLMDKTDASAVYQYTGIGDISLIKDGAMAWVEPDEKFYVALIQVHHEEDVSHIINLMKEEMQPEEWFQDYYDDIDTIGENYQWNEVSIEDFEFYVNGDYILVTYVDPELVEGSQRPSSEEMQGWFDKCIK